MKKKSWMNVCMAVVALFVTALSVNAGMGKEFHVPLEGQLDQIDARSIIPTQSAEATIIDTDLYVNFNVYVPVVTITIKNAEGEVVYAKDCAAPEEEIVSLAGLESGAYTLELTAVNGYMQGSFVYVP